MNTEVSGQKAVKDTLEELIELNLDSQRGFEKAADIFDDDALASTFRTMGGERGRMAAELRSIGSRYDVEESDGSMAGDLHRAWMSLKDAVTGDDHAILVTAEEGEDHAVETYEEALDRDLPSEVASIVRRQFADVKDGHDKVRDLRDARA